MIIAKFARDKLVDVVLKEVKFLPTEVATVEIAWEKIDRVKTVENAARTGYVPAWRAGRRYLCMLRCNNCSPRDEVFSQVWIGARNVVFTTVSQLRRAGKLKSVGRVKGSDGHWLLCWKLCKGV